MSILQTKKKTALLLMLLSISIPFLIGPTIQYAVSTEENQVYRSNSSISYDLNYTINYQSLINSPTIFKIWVARINNWSTVQSSDIFNQTGPENIANQTLGDFDIYNNSYDYYYKEMEDNSGDQSFNLQYLYNVTSSGIKWDIPDNLTLDIYDKDSPLYKFYTSYQPYVETNDTDIINTAQTLIEGKSSLNEMIEAVYLYVVKNLEYTARADSIGAAAALATKKGDCSEFSSLMVALLRTIGIPARKVLGFALVDSDGDTPTPKYDVKKGDVWSYSSQNNNLPGHAWVQYYIPGAGLGWVSADPTWGNSFYQYGEKYALQYLNQIEYLHLITTIGDFYGQGINPPLDLLGSDEEGIPEFPFFYPIGNATNYNFSFELEFKCTDVNLSEETSTPFSIWPFVIIGSSGSLLCIIIVFAAVIKRKGKKNKYQYRY